MSTEFPSAIGYQQLQRCRFVPRSGLLESRGVPITQPSGSILLLSNNGRGGVKTETQTQILTHFAFHHPISNMVLHAAGGTEMRDLSDYFEYTAGHIAEGLGDR